MVYRGNTLVASGIAGFDGRAVDGVEYMTRRKFMEITPNRNKFYFVFEEIAPEILGALAAGTAAGTKFTIAYFPHGASALEYILTPAAEVADAPDWPDVGNIVPAAGTAYTSAADIAAAVEGDKLTLYAINAAGEIFGAWQKVLASTDIFSAG